MNSSLSEIKNSALLLKKEERLHLAKSLLDSLDDQSLIVYEDEWLNVVREREKNYHIENSSTSWEEIKSEIPNRLTKS